MTIAYIEAGHLTASIADRIVTGLLLPFGEVGRTNLGKFKIPGPGIISIPKDVSVLQANLDHDQMEPVARILTATETPAGIVATFKVGENPEGDALLQEIEQGKITGKLKALSAEVKNVIIKAGEAVAGALTGAAFVNQGAFPSARLMAADTVDDQTIAEVEQDIQEVDVTTDSGTIETIEDEYTDDNGDTWKRVITRTKVVDGDVVTIDEHVELTPMVTETAPQPTQEVPPVDQPLNARVPETLKASVTAEPKKSELSKSDVFNMIATARSTGDRRMMAALEDVAITGEGAVGTATVVPQYVGELWSGRRFTRKVIPNLASAALTSTSVTGWRFTTKPAVATWTGNKADVPSNAPVAESYTVPLQRFAGAWDIAREFVDFGQTDVLESMMRYAVDSYAQQSDNYVLTTALTAVGAGTAVGTIPSGIAESLVKLVRGALNVVNTGNALPTWAIVATDVYEELALIQTNNALEFLSMSLNLEGGSLENFRIVPHASLDAGDVLVGAREAITVHELPGSPIRVNALDIAKGGVDEAVFGYVAARIDDVNGMSRIINNA
tara:strand:+ start:2838 stop:4505 length:1668 start_codon:yes stop_codon:yes gene_type:complete